MDRTEIRLRIVEAFIKSNRRRDTWAELAADVDHFEAIVMAREVPVAEGVDGAPRPSEGGCGGSGPGVNGVQGPSGGSGGGGPGGNNYDPNASYDPFSPGGKGWPGGGQ